ncbi:flagellin [Paracoccus shandongensis]|uniref:flagellin N-terminal helical domain-containing protein n=1 Tax=Paracoccus shandongensis TaxID=2816048 RepID=UPI001A8E0D2D|nr:flagellin [Paracoccus shandongensis]
MSSILTNNGAIVALQTLKNVNSSLNKAQSEISTGKSIAKASDNAAMWAISKTMETDQSAAKTIQSSLNVANQTVTTALAGSDKVVGLLEDMKKLAANAGTDGFDFATVQTQITEKMAVIAAAVSGSQLNGINLLSTDGINGTATFTALASLDRTAGTGPTTANKIEITSLDYQANIAEATVTEIEDAATALTALGEIEALLDIAIAGSATLGAASERITDQADFVGSLADSLKLGVSSLVDADMEEASARLQALQTQQQLGIQALSIANEAPSAILSLFR